MNIHIEAKSGCHLKADYCNTWQFHEKMTFQKKMPCYGWQIKKRASELRYETIRKPDAFEDIPKKRTKWNVLKKYMHGTNS